MRGNTAALVMAGWLSACSAGRIMAIGSPGPDGPGPGAPPAIPVETLPLVEAEQAAATLRCFDVSSEAQIVAVDPEGDVWLHQAAGLELLSVDGSRVSRALERDFAGIGASVARAGQLQFEADGYLWALREDTEIALGSPHEEQEVVSLCGELDCVGSHIVLRDRVLQRAADGWWEIDAGTEGFGTFTAVASRDGACAGEDERLWLGADRGVWRADGGASTFTLLDWPGSGATQIVVAEGLGVVVPGHGAIYHRSADDADWSGLRLSESPGAQQVLVSAAGSDLWVVSGSTVFHHRARWLRASFDLPLSTPTEVHAYAAGGAWLRAGAQLCHAEISSPIRVQGLEPYGRRREATTDLVVESEGASSLEIELDGALVQQGQGPQLSIESLGLGEAGWHRLSISAQSAGGASRREVSYYVEPSDVSFAADIAPLAAEHCSSCHRHRGQLTTPEEWRDNPMIRSFVATGNMPRDPAPNWGAAQKALIRAWYEGGMRP